MTTKLKEMIIKRARECSKIGMDIDGDIFEVFGKKYYVNIINDEVMEIE